MTNHLIRRGAIYYYRRRVPADLIEAMGKKEIQQSLGTSDPKEAARLSRKVAVEFDDKFERLRNEPALTKQTPEGLAEYDPATGAYIVPRQYTESDMLQHELDQLERLEEERNESWADERKAKKAAKQQKNAEEMKALVRAVLEEAGIKASAEPSDRLKESLQPKPRTERAAPSVASDAYLQDVLPLWIQARNPGAAAQSSLQATLDRFQVFAGRRPTRTYKRTDIIGFQRDLKEQGYKPATVRSRVGLLRALLSVAHDEGIIESNPAQGVRTDLTGSTATSRIAFSPDDLTAIFSSPVYSQGFRPRGDLNGEATFWLPLLALFTGARMEELGQLAPTDIRNERYKDSKGREHKVPMLYITDEGTGQGIKNEGSRRRVPVHKDLIALGFLDHVRKQQGERIFPELKPDNKGRETARFSYWFSTYLRQKCGVTDPRKTFHSFRHTFKDGMREVGGVEEQVSDALTGHTNGSVSRSYGASFYPIRPLVEAINKYSIAGFKLPK